MAYGIDDYRRERGDLRDDLLDGYEAILVALRTANQRLADEIIPRASHLAAAVLTAPVGVLSAPVVATVLRQALSYLADINLKVSMFMAEASLAPRLRLAAVEWTHIRAEVTAVAGALSPASRQAQLHWRGAAADAYQAIVPAHAGAASRLGIVADAIQYGLGWSASAVATLYARLLATVLAGLAAISAALAAAIASKSVAAVVFVFTAAAALLIALGDLFVDAVRSGGQAATFMTDALSEMRDNSVFPEGRWPAPQNGTFSDATVLDGDADWSLRRTGA